MERHTQKYIKSSCGNQSAVSRSNRAASSAPRAYELKNYKFYLAKSLKNKKNPFVLVLGATPELRDLAIKLGAFCVAADVSANNLEKLTEVMKFKNSDKNLFIKTDWLMLGKIFKPRIFDAVLADASLNNFPPKKHEQIFKDINSLLKPGGRFLAKNLVYLPEKPKDNLFEIQKKYDSGGIDWLWLIVHLGLYGDFYQLYDRQNKALFFGKLLKELLSLERAGKFKIKKEDLLRLKNILLHAEKITHIVFKDEDFRRMAEKYFIIEGRATAKGKEWTEYAPVWSFLKK
ncbi:MAG: class I SAM-dependent methyltransferase [Patescibacteria group bacterium]